MMSCIHEGNVLDYRYVKRTGDAGLTSFYIGDIYVGQIFEMKNGFSVVPKTPHELSPIRGLKTRWQAAELLLKMEGYQND